MTSVAVIKREQETRDAKEQKAKELAEQSRLKKEAAAAKKALKEANKKRKKRQIRLQAVILVHWC